MTDKQKEHDILFVDERASLAMAGYYEDLFLDNEMDDADLGSGDDEDNVHQGDN